MTKLKTFRNLKPEEAVEHLERLYREATNALEKALDRYLLERRVPSPEERSAFCYPRLRVLYKDVPQPPPVSRRAFAKLQRAGIYETTITHPGFFRAYLLEQLGPLVDEYGAAIEVTSSSQEIPYTYVFERTDEIAKAGVTAGELARYFPTPNLAAVGDEIADGLIEPKPGRAYPLMLFDAARVDYSLRRLVHYTGSDWRHTQRWVLLTNYHRYIDQFVQLAIGQLLPSGQFQKLIMPGNIEITAGMEQSEAEDRIAASQWHRYQMPAYHLVAEGGEGVSLINIGVGPPNAKNITDHLAVLRPHCWLMVGHCGGLRESQSIGDYVLAHAYLRQDHILDALIPPDIPIPALAEIQVALQDAAAQVTGQYGDALKQRLRTGTVVTNDDRNWELRFAQERRRINLSRAIAVDMESGTIAAQGFRLRVPYGTLLCVSDKPLHGEIKLPGAANAFYETAVAQHLEIGLTAIELLKDRRESLHSRKLRSFDEPPFR
ncbi:AMP nucleosidase [Filomicrobium insigne]|uniref:AMP nucleosidase n=1 Tax=Filomicrobium insigne TaxID=418854 RepID=A0A1H0JJK9_9HYPH|nr:AMP nucleosidase [Filomicrobium insigne]